MPQTKSALTAELQSFPSMHTYETAVYQTTQLIYPSGVYFHSQQLSGGPSKRELILSPPFQARDFQHPFQATSKACVLANDSLSLDLSYYL